MPDTDTMPIEDYLAQGGVLTSPANAPARYRGELLRLMATFVDSELAASAGFADTINAAPGITARIAAARIVLEKTDHAERVLKLMGDFGADVARYAVHHPWAARLPRDYIAVRFYFNESFPDTEENKLFVTSLLDTLTETNDVVLLNPDLHIDDHCDLRPGRNPRIHTVDDLMKPENNLDIQTKVISRARAFVGTYGGLSYLAPLYGVDSLSFFSERQKLVPFHLEHAQRVYGGRPDGRFLAVDTADAGAVSMTFQRAQSAVQ